MCIYAVCARIVLAAGAACPGGTSPDPPAPVWTSTPTGAITSNKNTDATTRPATSTNTHNSLMMHPPRAAGSRQPICSARATMMPAGPRR
jgi:hypothetical protein